MADSPRPFFHNSRSAPYIRHKMKDSKERTKSNFELLTKKWHGRVRNILQYLSEGVWEQLDNSLHIRFLKVVNLSVRSFTDRDLQSQAASLTYSTLLATVPVLAMLFAIARGFGFQNIIKSQLFTYLPAQREVLNQAFTFVDSYLEQASEGWFVGIGLIVMLWTLISLISNVESTFNLIWGVKHGRSFWRKITDYTAIFLILPILMICASGINVVMSSTLQAAISDKILSPMITWILDAASLILTWFFFVGAYLLIPNTRVPFKNAFFAGIFTGIGFTVLQWLFVSGAVYVSRYNAIYGSFAFLPLLLVWLHLVWVIVLAGAVICYSTQSIGRFSFLGQVNKISIDYMLTVHLAVLSLIAKRFDKGGTPIDVTEISRGHGIPLSLVDASLNRLMELDLINRVIINDRKNIYGYTPSLPTSEITAGLLIRRIVESGKRDFIPDFSLRFRHIVASVRELEGITIAQADKITLHNIAPDD